jgi:acyl transferase domain-containing protein/acyl carrier protein
MSLEDTLDIAVIGMACNFPRATNLDEYWSNLTNKVETIEEISLEQLLKNGVSQQQLNSPNYVKAVSTLENIEFFDAEFFGFAPYEAICMDPQHRVFLECCWQAFENAGVDPLTYGGSAAIFAGLAMNSYILEVLLKNPEFFKSVDPFQLLLGNDKDFLNTQISYKFNLKGPSINVNTACSTSLVAIHLARQSLLLGECDLAVAGGVSILLSNRNGYIHDKDSIVSPDGRCRAFDAEANGTIFGDGCGAVILKKLSEAIQAGDHIYAVIKGSAVNNDGSLKAGYTAPSVHGQRAVIIEALAASDLTPDQVTFIEAHGTGTSLGDPIEIDGLTQAYSCETGKKQYCPIGSVKTNMGHLNHASGIAGFIKSVLSVYHKKLPASLHYQKPNPRIDFLNSPFYVNTELLSLESKEGSIYAGINSMGIGGTNAHVIIGEAPGIPARTTKQDSSRRHILVLSARSKAALDRKVEELIDFLKNNRDILLQDIAFTLKCGRHNFAQRAAVLCRSTEEAISILGAGASVNFIENGAEVNLEESPIESNMLNSWLSGNDVDWLPLYEEDKKNESPRKIPLPSYPFERRRYWIDPAKNESHQEQLPDALDHYKKLDKMADWFYLTSWKQVELPISPTDETTKTYLVFDDGSKISEMATRRLKENGNSIIFVSQGDQFKQENDFSFQVAPKDPQGFHSLIRKLKHSGNLPESILFFWSLYKNVPPSLGLELDNLDNLVADQEEGFFSLVNLVKAMDQSEIKKEIELIVFTNNVFDAFGQEKINLTQSTIPGMCIVLQQELLNISCKNVDMSLPAQPGIVPEESINLLMAEIIKSEPEIICAHRGDKRFVKRYDRYPISENVKQDFQVNQNELVLFFGATEGIGSLVAKYMNEIRGAKLLILEECDFPEEDQWDSILKEHGNEDLLSKRILNAKKFIENGAVYLGKISNYDAVVKGIEQAERKFGKVKGIIHTPGSSNAKRGRLLVEFTRDFWKENFTNVCYSVMVLDRIFNNVDLDFKIVLNSLGSILGGESFVNVSTIGNYVKSYNISQKRLGKQPWSVQCWDAWIKEWDLFRADIPEQIFDVVINSIITNEEGVQCFEYTYILKDHPEIIISATDLIKRYDRWIKRDSLIAMEELVKYPRPQMDTPYIPPETHLEKRLENVFSGLLGIEKIGVDDNFFDLGGDSLLLIQLAKSIEEELKYELNKQNFLEKPTIRDLSLEMHEINL